MSHETPDYRITGLHADDRCAADHVPDGINPARIRKVRFYRQVHQACGSMVNLEVHHLKFRSHVGDDSELNVITLCAACHTRLHRRPATDNVIR
jgi:5-methylcytosine-specific restriction endonuclease McrA